MLTDRLKKFLEKNIELVEANKFNELYERSEDELFFSQEIGTLTRVLLSSGIDPIAHLKWIPYCYLYYDSTITDLNIPDHIEFIDSLAFFNCSSLETVILGKKVSVLHYGAFENSRNLKTVILNDGLLEIGQYAFRNTDIEKIRLPKSITSIDVQAFPELMTMQVYRDSYAESFAITNGYEVEYLD